ncbi:nose resistant to fluoxetine protein 6-like [Battus philenor]|uniref:nose resistant to fluoxetine protein 6-like n=1 Tax=Battus philenor TaxID=42288 RepID=UPI0035D01433
MFYQVFLNGTPIIQVFFIITGFLLGYKTRQQSEKITLSLKMIPKLIFLRWIRLVPVYAFVLAIISTWHRIAWTGPLWHLAVVEEAEHCRQKFWQNLLFINNYFDNTQCMPQTWYVSADTQLYCLGLILCVVLKTDASRKVVISFLMVAGVVIQGIVTYVMDLDGALLVYPDSIINFFINDPTFNNMYKRGHTNLSSFIIGLGMGFLVYHLIKNNFNVQKYKKYLWLYKYLIPSFVALSLLSSVFFRDAPRYPIYVRIAYVLLIKPMFTIILALFLLGLILRFDELYCGIMESKYWTITGRLSYSTYLVHAILIRSCLGSHETLLSSYFIHLISHCVSMVVGSFLLAIPVWLLIEAPCSQLVKLIFTGKKIPMGRKRLTYVKLKRQMTIRKH